MGRANRADESGGVYHMLNRSNRRDTILHKDADFEAFEAVLEEALERSDLLLYSYWVMPNQRHLLVSRQAGREMGRFGQWLTLTHTQHSITTRITAQSAKDISTMVATSRSLFKTTTIS